ncbi:MAG: flagellar hook-associated protein FlgK [Chitinivibrionales bacterium]|nr:flagellar hook-associated protein FlgK [Chitinivibrionales bacterium]
MGLFSTLGIGTRGLFAAQLGMDVAGQNISNADVEGYSRKRLNMTADYRYDGKFGQMGFGVDVVNIDRLRDAMIDQQIRRQNKEVGFYEEIDYALEQIENIFTEPSDTGVMHFVDQFFDSWENLANNPSDISARTMVKANAVIMNDVFHNLSAEMRDLRLNTNDKIARHVDRINEISKKVHNLNSEIGIVEIGQQNANDSRDQRDQLLKELAKIIDIDTIENEQGQVTVTTAGNILVSPAEFRQLETTTATFTRTDGTSDVDVGIRFADSKTTFIPVSGAIRGLMECRDTLIPEYESRLDSLATGLVEKVNTNHVQGYNLLGYSGVYFFNPETTGASDINISASIRADVQNIAAATGGAANMGSQIVVPAGSGQLDFGNAPQQFSKTLGRFFNSATDPISERARNIINGSVVVTAGATTLQEGADYHIDYASGTIQMLHGGYDGQAIAIDFQYRSGDFAGPGDNANAIAIAELRHQLTMAPDPIGNDTNTFTQYYSAMIGQLGLERNEASASLETREFLIQQYETHQDSISGVSLDEEMAEIIKYQHTFSAAARVITTTGHMLEVLMNM